MGIFDHFSWFFENWIFFWKKQLAFELASPKFRILLRLYRKNTKVEKNFADTFLNSWNTGHITGFSNNLRFSNLTITFIFEFHIWLRQGSKTASFKPSEVTGIFSIRREIDDYDAMTHRFMTSSIFQFSKIKILANKFYVIGVKSTVDFYP